MPFKVTKSQTLLALFFMCVGFALSLPFGATYFSESEVDFAKIAGKTISNEEYEWLRSAKGIEFGGHAVFANSVDSESPGVLAFYPKKPTPYPSVVMSSSDSKGKKSITVTDAQNNSISVVYSTSTGKFIEYDFTKVQNEDRVSFIDTSLDGEFDQKFDWGPPPAIYLKKKSKWIQWRKGESGSSE